MGRKGSGKNSKFYHPQVSQLLYTKILIVQTAFLGDVILVTPMIRAVKQLYPAATIDALVIPQTQQVLQNNPHLRSVILFDKRKNKFSAFWKTLRSLRKNKYDLAISPHSSLTTVLLLFLAGIKERVGFDDRRTSVLFTRKVPFLKNVHRIQKNLHLLSVFGDKQFELQTEIFPSEQDWKRADEWLSQVPFPGKPFIAVAPGSVWNTKRWTKEHYITLTKLLFAEQFNLVFIGAKDERDLCQDIIESADVQALNLAGKTSLLESAAIIARCKLMICNDSGALHIANAMQVDVFAFFGPTVKSIGYFPFRPNDVVFEREMDCRPCGKHGSKECPLGHHKCMKDILPEEVFEVIRKR